MQKPQEPAQTANRPRSDAKKLGAALKRNMARRKQKAALPARKASHNQADA